MTRIAILGGGISGLAAAYELELARKYGAPLDWHLYEASGRLGGILETTRLSTPDGDYILEGGPDAWVSEKPWARNLALELGLETDLIYSNDATRRTYILLDNQLQPMPDHMRMMVPDGLDGLDALQQSPLFSAAAKAAYAAEPTRAAELQAHAAARQAHGNPDESVATFVLRHFGPEVLDKIAAPLLSGVFGGDVHKLSVQSVMMPFVKMEREHGSLILALEARRRQRGAKPPQPVFTTLRRGMGSLVDALVATLPPERLHLHSPIAALDRAPGNLWQLRLQPAEAPIHASTPVASTPAASAPAASAPAASALGAPSSATASSLPKVGPAAASQGPAAASQDPTAAVAHVLLATPLDTTRLLLQATAAADLTPKASNLPSSTHLPGSTNLLASADLLPTSASSAVLATFAWPIETARTFTLPPGFGFLVPPLQATPQDPVPLSAPPTAQASVTLSEARSSKTSVILNAPRTAQTSVILSEASQPYREAQPKDPERLNPSTTASPFQPRTPPPHAPPSNPPNPLTVIRSAPRSPQTSVILSEARSPQTSVILSEARSAQPKDPCISSPGELRETPTATPRLLAATFVDQKFPHRAPAGARVLRAFFGGLTADALSDQPDAVIAAEAFRELQTILGPLPTPDPRLTTVRRWPHSLPQYEIGHLARMAQLEALVTRLGNLTLLGNSYRGVGVPDLIHAARQAARDIARKLPSP